MISSCGKVLDRSPDFLAMEAKGLGPGGVGWMDGRTDGRGVGASGWLAG